MKLKIFSFSDSNIAGYAWRWDFYLETEKNGTYRLIPKQVITQRVPEDPEYADEDEPIAGLRRGADIYDALNSMVSEAGRRSLDEGKLPTIAAEIAKLDPTVADQFRRGPKLLERREQAAAKKAAISRQKKLGPYRAIIDEYVLRFSDAPIHAGGLSGTKRLWAKRFIEQYVVDHGRLPTGRHAISGGVGGPSYSGGTHDFSDLEQGTRSS